MPRKLSEFINESLNDPHDFVESYDVPSYVLGQYEFDHNGDLFAVRFSNSAKYGKKASTVEFGRKVNKNVSKKLPKISNVRKFLATVVAIIKHHVLYSDNPKAQAKLSGFVISVPSDGHEIISKIISLSLKKNFKQYIIYPGFTENIYDPSRKVILVHRHTKKPSSVFEKIDLSSVEEPGPSNDNEPVALGPEDVDLGIDDEYLDPPLNSADIDPDSPDVSEPDQELSYSAKKKIYLSWKGGKFSIEQIATLYGVSKTAIIYAIKELEDQVDLYSDPFDAEVADNAADVYGDTLDGDEEEKTSSIDNGVYVNKNGKTLLVKNTEKSELKLWYVNASLKVEQSGIDLLPEYLEEIGVQKFEWKTTVWFNSFNEPSSSPYFVYSLYDIPNIIFCLYEGTVFRYSMEEMLEGATVFGRAVPQMQYKDFVYPKMDTNIFMMVRDKEPSPFNIMDLSSMQENVHERYLNDMSNDKNMLFELNTVQMQGLYNKFSEDQFEGAVNHKMKAILGSGGDPSSIKDEFIANPFPDDFDINKVSKLTERWPDINKWIKKSNIRTETNQPDSISLADGMITIDYEDDIMQIRKKFDKLKGLTGGERKKIKHLLYEYMKDRGRNAHKFVMRTSILQNEDPTTAYTDDDLILLSTYTGSGYNSINKKLRSNQAMKQGSHNQDFIEDFDLMFQDKGLQLPKGLIMYRGQSNSDSEIIDFNEGKEVEFAAYVSCTMDPSIAANFTKTGAHESSFALSDAPKDDFHVFDLADYEKRKRNKIMMTIKDAHKIPVLVPGKFSNVSGESEVILPRGTKVVANSPVELVHPRVYVGSFSITGIKGLNKLLESNEFKRFKMFCEAEKASDHLVKEMVVDVMIVDYLDDEERTTEELENLENFFQRMASQG